MSKINLIDVLIEYKEIIGLPDGSLTDIKNAINAVQKNEELSRIKDSIVSNTWKQVDKKAMPEALKAVEEINADIVPLFPAVCLIDMVPKLMELYKSHNISMEIAKDTLSDLSVWLRDYYLKRGVWGVSEYDFISLSFTFRLFKLGRLQFIRSRNELHSSIYRHNRTGELLAVAEEGLIFSDEGWTKKQDGLEQNAIVAKIEHDETNKILKGTVLTDEFDVPPVVEIDLGKWTQVIGPDTYVLDTHIQAGERLNGENAKDSFHRAISFWEKTFPNDDYAAFTCESWLLGKDLDKLLPQSSGIIEFWNMFFKIPIPDMDDSQIWERVFGLNKKPCDLSALEVNTSLQKALIKCAKEGITVNNRSGIILKNIFKN